MKLQLAILAFFFTMSSLASANDQAEGEKAAMAVLKGIRTKLTEEMAKDLVNSIGYCHENAIPLTEQFWKEYPRVTQIRRTSLKIRNTKNRPDEREVRILKEWDQLHKKKAKLPPFLIERVSTNEVRYYKPLLVEPLCLTCHGQPSADLKKSIHLKYPGDKATGYKEGELRGLIRVSLKPEQM